MSKNPCICINLRRIAQRVTDYYDRALKSTGVSLNQFSLLVNIHAIEGCGTGELAERVKLEKSTLVRTLQPLIREGLIIDKSPEGTRRRKLYLSSSGKKILRKAYPIWTRVQSDIAGKMGKSLDELMVLFEEADSWI